MFRQPQATVFIPIAGLNLAYFAWRAGRGYRKAAIRGFKTSNGYRGRFKLLRLLIAAMQISVILVVTTAILDIDQASAADLQSQLETLAQRHGFQLSGQEHMADTTPLQTDNGRMPEIGELLSGYNHVLIRSSDGALLKVIILGLKQALPPSLAHAELATRRQGRHHLVAAKLVGVHDASIDVELMIDTGSTYVVLPESLLGELGFEHRELNKHRLQTAKGPVDALVGELQALEIAGLQVDQVGVAFIEDKQLGNHALLGMTFLSRFRITLDDAADRLILQAIDRRSGNGGQP